LGFSAIAVLAVPSNSFEMYLESGKQDRMVKQVIFSPILNHLRPTLKKKKTPTL
jgi:hypothetical protein